MNTKTKTLTALVLAFILAFQNIGAGSALTTQSYANFAGVTKANTL